MSLAKSLIEIGALKINTENYFTWTSGIKSPIYCDNRLIISFPNVRNQIITNFVDYIKEFYPNADVIAGCATAGIPHAAWIADRLNLPMIYVRSKSKEHGLNNQIEGKLEQGQKVVVIEDLISTGGSSIKAANAICDADGVVLGILSIFSYNLSQCIKNMEQNQFKYHSLLNFDDLLDEIKKNEGANTNNIHKLVSWRNQLEL